MLTLEVANGDRHATHGARKAAVEWDPVYCNSRHDDNSGSRSAGPVKYFGFGRALGSQFRTIADPAIPGHQHKSQYFRVLVPNAGRWLDLQGRPLYGAAIGYLSVDRYPDGNDGLPSHSRRNGSDHADSGSPPRIKSGESECMGFSRRTIHRDGRQ